MHMCAYWQPPFYLRDGVLTQRLYAGYETRQEYRKGGGGSKLSDEESATFCKSLGLRYQI